MVPKEREFKFETQPSLAVGWLAVLTQAKFWQSTSPYCEDGAAIGIGAFCAVVSGCQATDSESCSQFCAGCCNARWFHQDCVVDRLQEQATRMDCQESGCIRNLFLFYSFFVVHNLMESVRARVANSRARTTGGLPCLCGHGMLMWALLDSLLEDPGQILNVW